MPLLALVAWMGPSAGSADGEGSRWLSVAIGVGAIVGLVLVGRFLLNPLFRVLAESKAREVMTAAALLVVLGAALLMQLSGLSMAMGAFPAGVLLRVDLPPPDRSGYRAVPRHRWACSSSAWAWRWTWAWWLAGSWHGVDGRQGACIYVVARIMG